MEGGIEIGIHAEVARPPGLMLSRAAIPGEPFYFTRVRIVSAGTAHSASPRPNQSWLPIAIMQTVGN
jgi:hypothetical protein